MNSEPSVPKCPQCGAAIPADAPQGLCPRCVLLGAATVADAGRPMPRTEPPSPDALRAAFPHLEIVELIGRGGMGYVYKARQAKLDRTVALKLLPLELGADPHFAERFHREARALARLNHPGIVAVYDFGVSAGFCYLLMEFVDGVNLRQAMQAGRFSPAAALGVVPKICEALQFAHEQGVLHRDIKPENILLDAHGRVKIADFGIAKLVGEDAPDLTLTLSGARLGTPTYMAPEQIEQPSAVDHRADIYSLGVVFYELLTGELPLGRFAPPSAKAALDARVDDIVMRALAKERELRQQSAGDVKTQVETVAQAPAPAASAGPNSLRVTSAKQWMRTADGEYRSPRTLFGRPVLHIAFGRDPATGRPRVARGIIAIGSRAVGALAIGGQACGLVAIGGLALGGLAVGGLGAGVLAVGGLAAGGISVGGVSLGLLLALGGLAIGGNAAGGLAIGEAAAGGLGLGNAVWDARTQHPDAEWLMRLLQSPGLRIIQFAALLLGSLVPIGATLWARGVLDSGRRPFDSRSPRPPVPPAMRRLAGWFFAVGGLAFLPTLVSLGTPVRSFNLGSLLLLTGWALWSANGWVRRLALLTNWVGLFASVMAWALGLAWLLRRDGFPGSGIGVPGVTNDPVATMIIGLLQLGAFFAGLVVLQRTEVRSACGLPSSGAGVRLAGRVAICLMLGFGILRLLRSGSVAVVDDRGQPAAIPQIPPGGDRAWLQVNSPAQTRVQFTVNCWSNGVPRPLSEGAWSPGELIFATNVPFQQFITRAVRPGGDGQTWDVSDYEPDGIMGEQWTDSGIPLTVPLRAAAPHGTAVQLNPGDRLRRWLFLPEAEAQQVAAGGPGPANPTWGVSMDLNLAIDSPSAEAQEAEMVSRLELQLPQGQATALRTVVWINGRSTSLPGAGMSLLPGLLSEPTVLHWRLRRLDSPCDWELVVTGARDERLLGPVRVNLGTNVTALQPSAETRLSPTAGTFNRWWPFLPSFVKGHGVTSPDSTFGWGISVDVGPQEAMTGSGAGIPKP